MIIDYRENTLSDGIEADVCIIGAGAAGLAIARTFIGTSVSVCIVESGGISGEECNQALYDGSSIGTPDFNPGISRMRAFGGSCNLWGGGCIPQGDISPRDWVPHSGWPITYKELKPYYTKAKSFCQIESHDFVEDSFLTQPAYPPLQFEGGSVINKIYAYSPILFGKAYHSEVEQAPNIKVLLHTNLLELEASSSGSSIDYACISSLDGHKGVVRANHFVLACGGIENARALLLSDSVAPNGLGNDRDLVGRYFMDHPSCKIGTIYTDDPDSLARPYDRNIDKTPVSSFPEICLSDEAQQAHRILNGRVRPFAVEGPLPKGIQALREFRAALRARKQSENSALNARLSYRKNGEPPNLGNMTAKAERLDKLALRVVLGIGDIAKAFVRKLAKQPTVKSDHVNLVGYFEQVPNRESRIVLGNELDALGQRKVCVDWQLTELDRHTYRTAAKLFGDEMARAGKGRFEIDPWLEDDTELPQVFGTSHHIGTTRMSDDPSQGVVDRECRVHGIDNLYVAGSSVFPTGGWAFPTFTIVAMSLRLAEYLQKRLDGLPLESSSEIEKVGASKMAVAGFDEDHYQEEEELDVI